MKTTFFFFAALAFASILHADDVYLKTGFVFRNVQVRDSTDGLLYIIRDGKTISILLSSVHKIEVITYDPNSKSKYELFSSDMAEQYKTKMEQEEKQKAAERARQIKIQQQQNTFDPAKLGPLQWDTYKIAGGIGELADKAFGTPMDRSLHLERRLAKPNPLKD